MGVPLNFIHFEINHSFWGSPIYGTPRIEIPLYHIFNFHGLNCSTTNRFQTNQLFGTRTASPRMPMFNLTRNA